LALKILAGEPKLVGDRRDQQALSGSFDAFTSAFPIATSLK
jgi:hypothetical protein